MSDSVHFSVIVPAFNEQDNLARVIQDTTAGLDRAAVGSYEIVVVDDGSVDGTGRVADDLAARYATVKVVHHDKNRGYGAAVRSGYAVATGRFITQIPADGELAIGEALALLADIGSSDVMASHRERPPSLHRDVLTNAFHVLIRLVLGFDASGLDGIFVIRGEVLKSMPLRSSTGLVNLETLMRCSQQGLKIGHGVVRVSPRLSGHSKVANVRTVARLFREVIALRWVIARERT
jgi:glycosyltransferase involved in cell wall biosynthesis